MVRKLRHGEWTAMLLPVQFVPRRQICPSTCSSCLKTVISNSAGFRKKLAGTGTMAEPEVTPPCWLWIQNKMRPSLPTVTHHAELKISRAPFVWEVTTSVYRISAVPGIVSCRGGSSLPSVEAHSLQPDDQLCSRYPRALGINPNNYRFLCSRYSMECPGFHLHVVVHRRYHRRVCGCCHLEHLPR